MGTLHLLISFKLFFDLFITYIIFSLNLKKNFLQNIYHFTNPRLGKITIFSFVRCLSLSLSWKEIHPLTYYTPSTTPTYYHSPSRSRWPFQSNPTQTTITIVIISWPFQLLLPQEDQIIISILTLFRFQTSSVIMRIVHPLLTWKSTTPLFMSGPNDYFKKNKLLAIKKL